MGRLLRTVALLVPVESDAPGSKEVAAIPRESSDAEVAYLHDWRVRRGRAALGRGNGARRSGADRPSLRAGQMDGREAMVVAGVQVRFATEEDMAICRSFDPHLPQVRFRPKVEARELLLAEVAGRPEGYLRLEYLWGKVPFIGLIVVAPSHRGKGVGKAMLRFLESHLREEGYRLLLSSSQVNEPDPQAWHRAVGFHECGILAGVNVGGIGEVFFCKELQAGLSPRN